MIETVQQRHRGATDFASYYEDLCALQDSCPVPAVKAHLNEGILDLNGDRIRFVDWEPLLSALRINKTLEFIALRSYFQLNTDGLSEQRATVLRQRVPALRGKDLTLRIARALRECLHVSEAVNCLELQGIILRERDMAHLAKGVASNNKSLTHLSLEHCRIGDLGVELLVRALRQAGHVSTLNLTGCAISSKGATHLAALLRYQGTTRHNEAWRDSLRYRRPNLDGMQGLRRLTLNSNPLLDDAGAMVLAETLKDDLWLKALDLQDCGIGSAGGRVFLQVLEFNATLVVLDLRHNPLIGRDLLHAITEQVLVNGDGKQSEFRWLKVSSEVEGSGASGKRPRSVDESGRVARQRMRLKPLSDSKRPAFRPAGASRGGQPVQSQQQQHVRSRSAGTTPRSARCGTTRHETEQQEQGMPWRTALRANRYKGYPPDHTPGRMRMEEYNADGALNLLEEAGDYLEEKRPFPTSSEKQKNQLEREKTSSIQPQNKTEDNDEDDDSTSPEISVVSPLIQEFEQSPPAPSSIKQLKVELMQLRRRLAEETNARRRADRKAMKLLVINQQLRQPSAASDVAAPLNLSNQRLLTTIENTFSQFNAFLDLLRDAGLGDIISAAGMDQDFASVLRSHSPSPQEDHQTPPKPKRRQAIPPSSSTSVTKPKQRLRVAPRNTAAAAANGNGLSRRPRAASSTTPKVKTSTFQQTYVDEAIQDPALQGLYAAEMATAAAALHDPVERSFAASERAKSEADRLYERLKKATQAGRYGITIVDPLLLEVDVGEHESRQQSSNNYVAEHDDKDDDDAENELPGVRLTNSIDIKELDHVDDGNDDEDDYDDDDEAPRHNRTFSVEHFELESDQKEENNEQDESSVQDIPLLPLTSRSFVSSGLYASASFEASSTIDQSN